MKTYKKMMTRILALVLICALMLPLAACKKPAQTQDPSADPNAKKTYTVQVKSAGGMALSGVGVYIYEDETQSELVWFDQTGEDGTMTFTDVVRDTYVAVLSDVPTGYEAEVFYPITGDVTEIVLVAGTLDEDNIQEVTYKLGDMVMDFTVTDVSGNTYTLSELLQQKKAVVLNFWYIECAPCNAEFPYLQEAYEQHSQDIALLALNPINAEGDIAAFQQEKGYTFPILSCGNEWEKLFGVAAYPTTIIIDRFGNICLKHTGTIDNAKTFADAFAYFAAEEYEQKIIDDIKSLETETEEGSADNPYQTGGMSSFQITVKPGQEFYTQLYKAKGMYLSVRGDNRDFYVLYNNKKYTPDSTGAVGFVVSTGDNYSPALFAIGNTGTQTQTYQVSLGHLPGTFNNPYKLQMGEFTAKVGAGNDQGIYYKATAPEDGTFIVQCIEAPAGVEYDFSLQSLDVNKTVLRNYRGDGTVDAETGYPTVTMPMSGGQAIMFSVGTLPDDSNSYPGGTFRFLVRFEAGELEEEEKKEKMDYTVIVTDPAGQPVQDITVWLTKDKETFSAKTDEQGIATLNLIKDTYTGTISLPEGFMLENNAFELTPEAPAVTIQLSEVVDTRVDYTVTALNALGEPVEGVEILVVGAGSAVTDAAGTVIFKLEPGNYTVLPGTMPEGLTCSETLQLTAEVTTGTFTLVAQEEEDPAIYTITFDPNGGTLTGEATAMTEKGKLPVLPEEPVYTDYTFLGWFTAPTGGDPVTVDTIYTADTTVYAQWVFAEYRVTFDACGGILEGQNAYATTEHKLAALPVPTREGYTFNGWFDAAEGGNAITIDTVYSANTTVYAQWTQESEGPQTIPYTVSVIDGNGLPVTSGVYVTWQSSTTTQTQGINNASGSVTANLPEDSYTIVLTLTGVLANYQYTQVTATSEAPAVTVQIAPPLAANAAREETYLATFFQVPMGATYVKLDSSQRNYVVEEGTAYCFFYFPITEEGKYTFTTTNGAVISNWGTSSFFFNKISSDDNNVITLEIKESYLHDGLALYFAVEVTPEHTGTILLVADAGEVEYTYMDAPFFAYEGTQTPEVIQVEGGTAPIEENIFKLTTDGKTLTYVDMLHDKPVKGEDGYYHLGSEDGPILYVNLGEKAPIYSLGTLVGAIGQFGTAFRKVFFNPDGTPELNADGTYRKEDYTDSMLAYCLHMDPTYGVYPLTDDLIYMIQNGGSYLGWYTPEDGNYLIKDATREIDPELLWMFAVCYLK